MKYIILFAAALASLIAQPPNISDKYGNGIPSLTCSVGSRYTRLDGPAGGNLYVCTATNTWTQVGTATAPVINAQSPPYNAVCDGTTAASTAIQDALTAAGTAGGTVVLPSRGCTGSYNLAGTGLTIPENVTLAGTGRVLSKLRYTGTGAAITMGTAGTATRNHSLRDFSLDLASAGTGAVGIALIRTFYDSISDVDVQFAITTSHTGQKALTMDGGSDFGTGLVAQNFTASGCMLYGVHLKGGGALLSYTASTFFGGAIVQSCLSNPGMTAGTSITGATGANPIVITAAGHGLAAGDLVKVSGVTGSIASAVNSTWVVSAADTDTLTLEGSYGSGLTYTSGGTVQLSTVGLYAWNGDQNKSFGLDVEDFAVGAAINRFGGEWGLRLEGNTSDWLVTANAEGTQIFGTFAPATIIDRGPITDWRSSSPSQEASQINALKAVGGLTVTGQGGTELFQTISLGANPSATPDIIMSRNYSGNTTRTTSSGNAYTENVKAGTGQGTANLQTWQNSSAANLSFVTSGGLFGYTVGANIASATTIAPTAGLHIVTGTTSTSTITVPTGFTGCVFLIPTGSWPVATGGNIARAFTAVANTVYTFCYNGTSWYPSGA